jgi:hypothetical protein
MSLHLQGMRSNWVVAFIVALLTAATLASAQSPTTSPSDAATAPDQPLLKIEEIEQIVAPIALYPDSLLSQMFMASTYPLEIVQADRWAKENKDLKDKALTDALEKQTWDASVKSLVNFPQVLAMMSEKLDMTIKLGDAFIAQQADVMIAVQKLRGKAQAEGNLKSNEQQKVIVEAAPPADPTIVVQPHMFMVLGLIPHIRPIRITHRDTWHRTWSHSGWAWRSARRGDMRGETATGAAMTSISMSTATRTSTTTSTARSTSLKSRTDSPTGKPIAARGARMDARDKVDAAASSTIPNTAKVCPIVIREPLRNLAGPTSRGRLHRRATRTAGAPKPAGRTSPAEVPANSAAHKAPIAQVPAQGTAPGLPLARAGASPSTRPVPAQPPIDLPPSMVPIAAAAAPARPASAVSQAVPVLATPAPAGEAAHAAVDRTAADPAEADHAAAVDAAAAADGGNLNSNQRTTCVKTCKRTDR